MKSFVSLLIIVVMLVFVPVQAAAQHSVALSATASTTPGIAGYNVYRAPCTGTVTSGLCTAEGTFAKINAAVLTAPNYTDATVLGGFLYSYYMTATCPAAGCATDAQGNKISGESTASNHIGAAIAPTPPLPPGNLAITSVARYTNPDGSTYVIAKWQGVPNLKSTYTFYGNGKVLSTNTVANASGIYQASWQGAIKVGAAVSFEVCDANGACSSKLI